MLFQLERNFAFVRILPGTSKQTEESAEVFSVDWTGLIAK